MLRTSQEIANELGIKSAATVNRNLKIALSKVYRKLKAANKNIEPVDIYQGMCFCFGVNDVIDMRSIFRYFSKNIQKEIKESASNMILKPQDRDIHHLPTRTLLNL